MQMRMSIPIINPWKPKRFRNTSAHRKSIYSLRLNKIVIEKEKHTIHKAQYKVFVVNNVAHEHVH